MTSGVWRWNEAEEAEGGMRCAFPPYGLLKPAAAITGRLAAGVYPPDIALGKTKIVIVWVWGWGWVCAIAIGIISIYQSRGSICAITVQRKTDGIVKGDIVQDTAIPIQANSYFIL